jgi:hypothetical protein
MKKVEHTTIRNGNLFCLNCGGSHPLGMPIPIDVMTRKIKAFNVLHADCLKTWKEPVVDQNKTVLEKALFWKTNGEHGLSSMAIWKCLMGYGGNSTDHPYDPDDFYRCYKLLQCVPEWKMELNKVKSLSKEWSNLVDNWDKLTEMLEEQLSGKENEMYEFMQTLI